MSDGPVYLKESAVRKPESGMPRGTAPKHPNMTAEQWKKVPQWLEAPAAVFDSDTVPGALVAIGPELVNGAVVMLTIEPRSEGPDRGVTISLLTNAYDKDKGPPPMGRWLREGKAWYVDKKKFPDVLRRVGLQLPDTAYQNKPGTRKILTERNLDGYLKANPPLLSRTAAASPQQQPAPTPAERADDLIHKAARTAQPLDAVARAITRATGVEWASKKLGSIVAGAASRYTPETIKAGLVSDYGLDPRVRDERVLMQARQQVQLRKAGEMIDSLASLTRDESAAAYRWMNETDPQAIVRGMDELPEGSVEKLQKIQRVIDKLSQEAVDLGQLDQRSYERNKFAYPTRLRGVCGESNASCSAHLLRDEGLALLGLRIPKPARLRALCVHVGEFPAPFECSSQAIAARRGLQLLRWCRWVVDVDGLAARLATKRVAPVELHGAVCELAGLQGTTSIKAAVQRHEGTAVERFNGCRSRRYLISCHSPQLIWCQSGASFGGNGPRRPETTMDVSY